MTARTAARGARRNADRTRRISKAERRRIAQRRAAQRRAAFFAVVAVGFVAAAIAVRQNSSSNGAQAAVSPGAVRGVSTTPFPSSDGGTITLSQFSGAPLVLYFYEGQSCGACQTQLQEIQGIMPDLQATGANVLGVTMDPVGVSTSVAAQLHLSYPILEDVDHQLGSAMGTYVSSGHMGATDQHSVVVLGADGSVTWRMLAGTTMYVAPSEIVDAVKAA
jgi:peroxiredoxin Q/BCP